MLLCSSAKHGILEHHAFYTIGKQGSDLDCLVWLKPSIGHFYMRSYGQSWVKRGMKESRYPLFLTWTFHFKYEFSVLTYCGIEINYFLAISTLLLGINNDIMVLAKCFHISLTTLSDDLVLFYFSNCYQTAGLYVYFMSWSILIILQQMQCFIVSRHGLCPNLCYCVCKEHYLCQITADW